MLCCKRCQLMPSRIGDRHSIALANGTHGQLRLTGKEHGFHSLRGQAGRHRGALRLDLSAEPLQVGEAGDIDGQDERTVYSSRSLVARRVHLGKAAADELGEQAASAPLLPAKWQERAAGVEIPWVSCRPSFAIDDVPGGNWKSSGAGHSQL